MPLKTPCNVKFLKECSPIVSRFFFQDVDTQLANFDSDALPFDQINSINFILIEINIARS